MPHSIVRNFTSWVSVGEALVRAQTSTSLRRGWWQAASGRSGYLTDSSKKMKTLKMKGRMPGGESAWHRVTRMSRTFWWSRNSRQGCMTMALPLVGELLVGEEVEDELACSSTTSFKIF